MSKTDLAMFWLAYANPLMGCPAMGSIHEADAVWVLAFGRNTFPDKGLGAILEDMGAGKIEDLLVFEKLANTPFDPGGTNRSLAQKAAALAGMNSLPLVAQWEVTYAVWRYMPHFYDRNARKIVSAWAPASTDYYPTSMVLQDMAKASERFGTKRPILVAQRNHLARGVAIAWKQGVNPVVSREYAVREMDRKSIQPPTQRLLGLNPTTCFLPREVVARWIHHPVNGMVSLLPPA